MNNKISVMTLKPFFLAAVLATFLAGCTTTQSPRIQVNDARITAEVKSKLAQDVMPSSLVNVKVNTTNGVVTLAGQVENEDVKQRAEMVAVHVNGVVKVNNDLQVEPSPTQALSHGGNS